MTPQELKEQQRKRAARRSDILYVTGALLASAGVSFFGIRYALLAAGFFCLLLPLLELAGSFLRGLRLEPRNR